MSTEGLENAHDRSSGEQRLYADWLDLGTKIGFLVLLTTFLLYAFAVVPPGIPLENLPRYWHLPVGEFIALTGAPQGWAWVARLGEGDLLNFVGVAILGLVTVVCYARILPRFARSGEWTFVAICVLEIVVLVTAAAGVFGAGH